MRRTFLSGVTAILLAAPPAAWAQDAPPVREGSAPRESGAQVSPASGTAQLQPAPPALPKPNPVTGRISVRVRGGQSTRKLRYVARGGRIRIEGRSKPFVAGQIAVLSIYRRGRLVTGRRAEIRPGRNGGRVGFSLKVRRRGLVKLVISHGGTDAQSAFRSRAVRIKAIAPRAGQGARGRYVLLLQRGLRRLGFAVPVTGFYDGGTSRAVLAFRKANHLGRTGYASTRVFSLVLRNRGAFRVRFPRAGRHVEFDWSSQLLALIDGGRPRRVYHASSGKASTPTVFGTFRFYRKEPGTNSHGMVHSNYFIGGYAIHGYASVPSYPASHGCIRVPIGNALNINRQISLGDPIFVYR